MRMLKIIKRPTLLISPTKLRTVYAPRLKLQKNNSSLMPPCSVNMQIPSRWGPWLTNDPKAEVKRTTYKKCTYLIQSKLLEMEDLTNPRGRVYFTA